MKNWEWVLGVGLCVALAGCSLQTGEAADEAGGGDENIESTTQPLIGGWASRFDWAQGQPARAMELTSSHVCVLSKLGGRFSNTSESVRITATGGRWVLSGASQRNGVNAEALCFPIASFQSDTNIRSFGADIVSGVWNRAGACRQGDATLGLGTDFGFLTGFQGETAGGGEFAQVIQSPSVNTLTLLRVQTCLDGHLWGYGGYLRVSLPRQKPLVFLDGDNNARDVDFGEFTVGGNVSSGTVTMAKTKDAMCALTRISGKFFGGGEWVQIAPSADGSRWELKMSKGGASDYVRASARCFAQNQTLTPQ